MPSVGTEVDHVQGLNPSSKLKLALHVLDRIHNPDVNPHPTYQNSSDCDHPKQLGYKLVGDNIDKGVKARYMRNEKYHASHFITFTYLPSRTGLITVTTLMCTLTHAWINLSSELHLCCHLNRTTLYSSEQHWNPCFKGFGSAYAFLQAHV